MDPNYRVMKIIKRPIFTDRTTYQGKKNKQYVFYVNSQIMKIEILLLVEQILLIQVIEVNTCLKLRRCRKNLNCFLFCKQVFVILSRPENIASFLSILTEF